MAIQSVELRTESCSVITARFLFKADKEVFQMASACAPFRQLQPHQTYLLEQRMDNVQCFTADREVASILKRETRL